MFINHVQFGTPAGAKNGVGNDLKPALQSEPFFEAHPCRKFQESSGKYKNNMAYDTSCQWPTSSKTPVWSLVCPMNTQRPGVLGSSQAAL